MDLQELENIQKPEQPPQHFDPTDELSREEIDECVRVAEEKLQESNDPEINLAKSDIRVPNQNWVLVSFVGEDLSQKTKELGMKIWGTFAEIKDAKEHADKINKSKQDKNFDVYILEMYCWAMIPPKKEYIEDQTYHEEKLHEIITERKRQQTIANEVFEKRKTKLQNNQDMNEYIKNKEQINKLMGVQDEESNEKLPTDMGGEIHKKIFGEPEKLPKVEILDDNDNVVSVSQGLTESDEEYKERLKKLEESRKKNDTEDSKVEGSEEKVKEILEDIEDVNPHLTKFYNK